MRYVKIYAMLLVMSLGILCVEDAVAQNLQERKVVREGNEAFKEGEYRESLDLYNRALEIDPECMEATYNRANAYHHVMRTADGQDTTITWQQSNKYYEDMLSDSRFSDSQRAEVLRNIGESLMSQQEYEAALNAFRESLLLNPKDAETKYNYVLAKRIVDQKRQQNQDNDQNNQGDDSNQNQDQNQNQNQNQGGGDQNENQNQNQDDKQQGDNQKDDKGDGDQQSDDNQQNGDDKSQGNDDQQGNDQQQDGDQQDGNGQPQPQGLSDEQERLLDAIQGEEDKTQEKLNEGAAAVYVPGKKNW